MRLNLFANHINQLVHLKRPEFPKVFTNFENQVGEHSVAYSRAKEDFVILAKVEKNAYNYDLIVKYRQSGVFDILHFNTAHNITEDYGYKVNDFIPDKDFSDIIHKDTMLYASDNYDEDWNFSYGVNLKALYLSWNNMTYEDGIILSRSAAEKLTSYKVEKKLFSINTNDVLLNLYGDDNEYKSFPKVGDYIDSKILVAMRRRDKRTILYDFSNTRMREVDPVDDEVIYTGGGTVVDINIYNNISLADLRKKTDIFNQEVLGVLEDQYRYWKKLAKELEAIIPVKVLSEKEEADERSEFGHVIKHPIPREENPNKYTDELGYYWKLAHEQIDEKVQWRSDGKSFDNFKIEFVILKENPLTEGCKITGRYGNKGIISMIIDDNKMPITTDGIRAEVILNPLGVVNRLNPAQLQEQYINFMSDHVIKLMKETDSYQEKEEIFFSYLKELNKKEFDFYDLEYLTMNRAEKYAFLDNIEENGIYIHQPPFFGNTTPEQFEKIYREHPEWCEDYEFEGIENRMTMGDIYFIRLKHESSNKASIRSASNLNVKNLPSKSTLKKEGKLLYSQTPIRLR